MDEHKMEETLEHIKIYIIVFAALAVLTVVTVWASYLKVSPGMHVVVAMAIASVKGGLVLAYFMHLITEKKAIRGLLILTAFFFMALMLLTFFSNKTLGPLAPHIL